MSTTYTGWAILELMGHRRRAGVVAEVEEFGAKLLRIDIPAGEGSVTEYYGGSAIYCLRPCSEEVGRRAAEELGDLRPVRPTDFRPAAALPAPDGAHEDEFVFEDEFDAA